ncbi:MAG: AAA domain-containing protein, partial [Pirellulaceae bacterium]
FYDGRLLTVPDDRLNARTQTALNRCELLLDRPLSFHFQDAAVYDKRRNSAEAEYIAQLVRELLQQPERQSIGVIAFSEAQQEEILSALNRLAQEDDAFRGLYEEELQREVDGQFVGLLVKNLENIQGDERDIVILSICYGPGPQGKMLMNFGPINQSGGEKRLNVAFSRAKRHMAVVSSIRHAQVTNDYNEGANCLKNYLRYAEACSTGDLDGARRALASVSRWHDRDLDHAAQRDVVATQLADRLRQRGFLVEEGVGQSHFRVDLAVRQPHDTRYRLGLLVDTVAGYQQAEPLERDVMRPRLLRQFGWQIATVLAKDWYRDEAHEMERLVQLLSEPESGP